MAVVITDAEKSLPVDTTIVYAGSESQDIAVGHPPEGSYDRAVEKNLVRKIDFIVLPCLGIIDPESNEAIGPC